MRDQTNCWNREELYQLAWCTPMTKLAATFGISDVGLAQVCYKLKIPLPGRGHWAKIAAGQRIERPPLEPLEPEIFLEKPRPRPPMPRLDLVVTEEQRFQIERLEAAEIPFSLKRGRLSHPLVVAAREALKRSSLDSRKILMPRQPCLDLRVSKQSLERALRLAAGVISAAEDEGFRIVVGNGHKEETWVDVLGQEVRFGIVEKVDRVELRDVRAYQMPGDAVRFGGRLVAFRPTGVLTIEVWRCWEESTKRWKDVPTHPLERMIPKVVAGFIRIALLRKAKQGAREAEARERRRLEEERAKLVQKVKDERARVAAMRRAAVDWQQAELIRAFLDAARKAALRAGQPVAPGTPFGDWLAWAVEQADRLDPLKVSPRSIIDDEPPARGPFVGHSYGRTRPDSPFGFPKPIWKTEN